VISAVVGERNGISSPETCSGFSLPLVFFNRIYSFTKDDFIKSIPRPKDVKEEDFSRSATGVVNLTIFTPDNLGASDEDRAKNFVVLRYPGIYRKVHEMITQGGFTLETVIAIASRLSGMRKLVDVIFTFVKYGPPNERQNWAITVDVQQKFPFIAPGGDLRQVL
jgi:hypothetical protein